MEFWFFMTGMVLLIPLSMIGFGRFFMKRAPKKVNMWFGYRTPMAMKNRDTWEFAHRHFGRTWYITGLIMLVVSLGVMIYVRAEGTERIGTIGGVFSMINVWLCLQ